MWPGVIAAIRSSLPEEVPIAVTEHNLVSNESRDTSHSMTRAVNALYMADTIGQLVIHDVHIANQWNLANGTTSSGTDYGMIDVEDLSVFPQYHAMAFWARTGETMLATEGTAPDGVHIYPTRRADGTVAVILVNLDDSAVSFELGFASVDGDNFGNLTTLHADDLAADALIAEAPRSVSVDDHGAVALPLAAWSLNLLEVGGGG